MSLFFPSPSSLVLNCEQPILIPQNMQCMEWGIWRINCPNHTMLKMGKKSSLLPKAYHAWNGEVAEGLLGAGWERLLTTALRAKDAFKLLPQSFPWYTSQTKAPGRESRVWTSLCISNRHLRSAVPWAWWSRTGIARQSGTGDCNRYTRGLRMGIFGPRQLLCLKWKTKRAK